MDVIVAQAPLFSTNPKFGQKLGWLGLYHTTLVLSQTNSSGNPQFWTLEFDYIRGNVLTSIIPDVIDGRMVWNKSARFCLSEGLLWGREHWTKTFKKVARLSAAEAQSMLNQFIVPLNSTASDMPPQYQLWRVVKPSTFPWGDSKVLIPDVTCADGVNWILHYLSKLAHVPLLPDFKLRGTSVFLSADRVLRVSQEDSAAWADMNEYFSTLKDLISANKTEIERLHDVVSLARDTKYVHDGNTGEYYMLVGSRDRVHFSYRDYQLEGPPFQKNTSLRTAFLV